MNGVILDYVLTQYDNRRNLQHVANQRNNSTIRSLAFGNARFFIDIEYANLSTCKTANDMYKKTERARNIAERRQLGVHSTKREDNQLIDQQARERT